MFVIGCFCSKLLDICIKLTAAQGNLFSKPVLKATTFIEKCLFHFQTDQRRGGDHMSVGSRVRQYIPSCPPIPPLSPPLPYGSRSSSWPANTRSPPASFIPPRRDTRADESFSIIGPQINFTALQAILLHQSDSRLPGVLLWSSTHFSLKCLRSKANE